MLQRTDPFNGLPRGYYRALAVDPPWSYACFSEKGKARSADRHYATMASPAIEQLPVGQLAARDAHLFLWITGPCLVRGMHLPVMRSWGFEPSATAFVWIKPKRKSFANGNFFLSEELFAMGMGHTTRQNAEFVMLGRRGDPRRLRKDVHQLIIQPRREHSRKPDEFYTRVEHYCTGPYLELFARQRRPGWDSWGNETDKFEPEYDAQRDFAESLAEGYRAIRERVAAGGPGWTPKPAPLPASCEMPDIPEFLRRTRAP